METEIEKKIREILNLVRKQEFYPDIKIIEEGFASGPEFTIKGKNSFLLLLVIFQALSFLSSRNLLNFTKEKLK